MATIYFHYKKNSFRVRDSGKVKEVITEIFKDQKIEAERVDYIFCSDSYLLELNKKFLSHDYYTDIITFSLSDQGKPVIGEIYISSDRVKDNAKKYHQPGAYELKRVIFHGILHLCGFEDQTMAERDQMKDKENYYLKRLANVS